jgi:hypothetical protein
MGMSGERRKRLDGKSREEKGRSEEESIFLFLSRSFV